MNWEERTLDDSFRDARDFAIDLAVSLEGRLDICITNGVKEATFFDIEHLHRSFWSKISE